MPLFSQSFRKTALSISFPGTTISMGSNKDSFPLALSKSKLTLSAVKSTVKLLEYVMCKAMDLKLNFFRKDESV